MNLKITLKTGLFIAACCIGINAHSQVRPKKFGKELPLKQCGTTEYQSYLQQKYPQINSQGFEQWLAPKAAEAKAKNLQKDGNNTNDVITIPVVVHVIHNGSP